MADTETRAFDVTTEIPTHFKSDGNGGRVRVEAQFVTETVEITVDWLWMAKQIGPQAVRNIGKRSTAMCSAIVAKSLGAAEEEDD